MKNFSCRLINPCGNEKDEYLRVYNELFKNAFINSDWLEWYHNNIPSSDSRLGQTRTYGLFDYNRLIGIWSVEPKILRIDYQKLINVGRCFAVGISQEYRRMGLFVVLSEFAIKCEKEKAEYDYIIGFPQTGRSVIGGHLKAGWEEIAYIDIYSVNLEKNDGSSFRRDVSNISDFHQVFTTITSINSFDEMPSYRNIRYINHPQLQYTLLSYEDAYLILKPYSTFCHILEMKGLECNMKKLVEASKSICKRHGLEEINIWNNSSFQYFSILNECGFSLGSKYGLPITIIAVKINAKNKLIIENEFNFGMGVEEGY
ncbi:MAG: hypothetical protein PHS38_13330 [Bacteroidales bacterium]|nr:hypothetical protein [Bacteroidales bacterium]